MSTSAAPYFFKAKDVDNIDTFQDGGLQHNMPAFIASWECAILWPDRCQILEPGNGHVDHMISLGTGTSTAIKHKIGPHSPVKDRFVKRLYGNCMVQMDSEKQWKTFIQCIPEKLQSRYHRLNICFPGPEPAMDEVNAMPGLKLQAQQIFDADTKVDLAEDTITASIFYFELDSVSSTESGLIQCSGTIMCRLPLDDDGRMKLQKKLSKTKTSFIVRGHKYPFRVNTLRRKIPPPFRMRLDFKLNSETDDVHISVQGITSLPTLISGLPRSLHHIVEAQGLDAPFGCSDHREIERALPNAPPKRKFHLIEH